MLFENSITDIGIYPNDDPINLAFTLINDSLILPNKPVQSNILVSLILSDTSFLTKIPNCLAYGLSGTGKSTILKLVCALHGYPFTAIKTGVSTAVSARNYLQALKFSVNGELTDIEQNSCYLLDDINPSILDNNYLLSMLKSGYDKKTAIIEISAGNGKNMIFNCFTKYFYGSIHPLWSFNEFSELIRRWVIIKTCKYDDLSDSDKAINKHPLELLDIDFFDFTSYQGLNYFYQDNDKLSEINYNFKQLKKLGKDCQIDISRFTTYQQVMAVNGLFLDLQEVINIWEKFVTLQNQLLEHRNPLETFLIDCFLPQYQLILKDDPYFEISNDMLKNALRDADICDQFNNRTIKEVMLKLGFRQVKGITSKKLVWKRF